MKTIFTNKGDEIKVSDKYYDYLNQYTWSINAKGYPHRTNYIMSRKQSRETGISRKQLVLMHRLIMVLEGHLDSLTDEREVDHINRERNDNRISNLRVCPIGSSINAINATKREDNSSGYKGVNKHKGKWLARVQFRGKRYHAGYHDSLEAAALAYNKKALELHGKFPVLNSITT